MERKLQELETRECPICRRHINIYEMYCICGYEFGGNRCTNSDCGKPCGDFTSFYPDCGSEIQNFLMDILVDYRPMFHRMGEL